MRVVTDRKLAITLGRRNEAVFYSHFGSNLHQELHLGQNVEYVIGRRYEGLFDAQDGSYVTIIVGASGETRIDRDSYGAIPLFYSTVTPVVSTDMSLLVEINRPQFNCVSLSEYLSAAYLTAGRTIYQNLYFLMPNEKIVRDRGRLFVKEKKVFPTNEKRSKRETVQLLDAAIDNSINDLLDRYPGQLSVNLSGGTDSTLLLAKIRAKEPRKGIVTTTYFHDDWRDDIDDWKYADQASKAFGSLHRLIKVNNASLLQEHRDLVARTQNVFHTYAASFFIQHKDAAGLGCDVPIINGSGPDESIIGTEKIPIVDLLALQTLKRESWIDYLIANIDYIKMSEGAAAQMLLRQGQGFVESRRSIAKALLDSTDFVEFQRRYHALTILQDHIQELSSVALALNRPIIFPYLTNDIFRVVFSTDFNVLNTGGIYKAVFKELLSRFMPSDFVHRPKIGFQSPSRPYFKSDSGFGPELTRLLSKGSMALNVEAAGAAIRERLDAPLDLRARYDFLEWTAYNILLLEELQPHDD
jgi:asparagine synthetase B (glutamine-hydrolysing)